MKDEIKVSTILTAFLLVMLWQTVLAQRSARLEPQRARYGVNIWRETEGLPQSRIRDIVQTRDGYLWLATDDGVVRFNGASWFGTVGGLAKYQNRRVTTYTEFAGAPLGTIRSLAEDAQGTLWIGATQELLLLKQGRLVRHPRWQNAHEIKVLYRDKQDQMWVGTDGDGLFCLTEHNVRAFRTSDGLASNQIRALAADRQGALWIGMAGGGVSRFADGRFTAYTTRDGLAGNRVHAIHEDEEGALWFATREGLSRWKDGRFVNFTVEAGLLTSFVYSILDDGRGNFWFSCSQGVFRVNKEELRAVAAGQRKKVTSYDYGIKDGMKTRTGNPGNQPTAWKAADGTLLFCTLQGLVIADPTQRTANTLAPPVYIEEVFINKQRQTVSEEPALPLGAGEIEIHFAALNYTAPEKMRYQYRLAGFDPDWIDAGTRRFAYYANLAPGRYRFQVRAGNLDGPWNETGAAFGFYLQPRFYRTQLFYALVGLTVFLIVVGIYRLRMHGLKVRYSAVLAERNRIAGEIHDTLAQNLAGIALQLDSVTMQLSDVPKSLRERLDQACNLTRYSLAEARRAVTDLRSDDLEPRELAAALPEIVNKLTAASGLQTRIEVIGTPRRLHPMAEKNLLRIFQEAVANAVKHAHARNLHVELRYDSDHLTLRVRDDGCGFDTNQIVPLGVGHYGLTGMRERAERIGGHLQLQSQPGAGTELLIEAPFAA